MRRYGISYDTGFINAGRTSREVFEPSTVRRELQIIRDDLGFDAVRVTGGDPERLETAARLAAELGLEVWFSPFTCDLSADEMLALLADCADRAERLRDGGAEVVFVTGAELSLLNNGFLPGDRIADRLGLLSSPDKLRALIPEIPPRINEFLASAVTVVRERFGGRVTYAAIPFENVDWSPFDIVSLDLYRSAEVADRFREGIRSLVAQGKPAAITEFGTASYHGAADRGARAGEIVKWDEATGLPAGLDGDYERDEAEQARYILELLEVFETEGVDTAFVFTFALYQLPHRPDGPPREDLDLGSYGIVKVLEGRIQRNVPRHGMGAESGLRRAAGPSRDCPAASLRRMRSNARWRPRRRSHVVLELADGDVRVHPRRW